MKTSFLHAIRDRALLRGDMKTVRRIDQIWARRAARK